MPRDILLSESLDIQIIDGDFFVGESTAQHQKTLILSDKCEFKEVPMRGVGALRYLEDQTPDNLAREIRQEFSVDGMNVSKIKIETDLTIQVEATYQK